MRSDFSLKATRKGKTYDVLSVQKRKRQLCIIILGKSENVTPAKGDRASVIRDRSTRLSYRKRGVLITLPT